MAQAINCSPSLGAVSGGFNSDRSGMAAPLSEGKASV
jgi:hypothetical protein